MTGPPSLGAMWNRAGLRRESGSMGAEASKVGSGESPLRRIDPSTSPLSVRDYSSTQKPKPDSRNETSKHIRSPQFMRDDRYSRNGELDSLRRKDSSGPFKLPISPPPIRRGELPTQDASSNELRHTSHYPQEHRLHPSASPGQSCHVEPERRPQTPSWSSSIDNQHYNGRLDGLHTNVGPQLHVTSLSWRSPAYEALKAEVQDKVEHKGLTGVPTGPKQFSGTEPEAFKSFEAAESAPHIFIPDRSLNTLPTTHKHLAKFLRVSEQNIFRRKHVGWRIIFPDSETGRRNLNDCYDEFKHQLFFSQYILDMQRFPNGSSGDLSANHAQRHQTESSPKTAELEKQETSHFEGPRSSDSNLRKTAGLSSARSSPAVTRMDKDDSSSALTGSDSSASKGSKCHVCQTRPLSGAEALIPCSTCPRKYHRRCHPAGSLPADLDSLSTWQCQRCVKKQVPPKSRLSTASFPAASPVPSVGQPGAIDGSFTDKDRELQKDQSGAQQHMNTANPSTSKPSPAAQTHVARASLSEADDLVEKSFVQLRCSLQDRQPPKKTGRLALVRKKIDPLKEPPGELQAASKVDASARTPDDEVVSKAKRKLDIDEPISNKRRAQEGSAGGVHKTFIVNGVQGTGSSIPVQMASSTVELDAGGASKEDRLTTPAFRPMTKPNPKQSPVTPQLRKPGDSSEPKGNPHKWLGGGKEKDVFRERFGSYIDTEDRLLHGQHHVSSTQAVKGTQSGRVALALEEQGGSTNRSDATGRQREPSSLEPNCPEETASVSETSKPRFRGPRAKLNKDSTRPCVKCGRPATTGPAGNNMHCSRCKKEARNLMIAQTIDTTPITSGQGSPLDRPSLPNFAADLGTSVDYHMDQVRARAAASNEEESGRDDILGSTDLLSSSGGPKKVRLRPACDWCRSQRKKCHHRSDSGEVRKTKLPRDVDERNIADIEKSPTKPRDSNAANRGGKDINEEAQLEEVGEDAVPSAGPKRKCHRSTPKDEFDLGNSSIRPQGTYEKLIGMALCSTEGLRMKYSEVVEWIAKNVPGYNLKEGNNWENGIKATISMCRYQSEEKPGLWHTEPVDPLKRAKGNVLQLLPGLEKSMLHWDPVLKTPVSPLKLDRTAHAAPAGVRKDEDQESHAAPPVKQKEKYGLSNRQVPETPEKKDQSTGKQRSKSAAGSGQPGIEQADTEMQDSHDGIGSSGEALQHFEAERQGSRGLTGAGAKPLQCVEADQQQDSSDEEPLSHRKRSRPNGSAAKNVTMTDATKQFFADPDNEDIKAPHHPEIEPQAALVDGYEENKLSGLAVNANRAPQSQTPIYSLVPGVRSEAEATATSVLSLAKMIEREWQQDEFRALSLFEEWPEYDPSKQTFDKAAKIAEIKARPRRKQRFKAPLSRDSRTGLYIPYASATAAHSLNGNPASFDRPNRTPRKSHRAFDAFQPENAEPNVTMCGTWEEFFDLPSNPIPVLHDGQLAYRDGTTNEDGLLPRAKMIFKTGYAR